MKFQTYTGRFLDPTCIKASDITLVDIAHSLSMQCRYNGQCKYFYSIAQHSLHVSSLVSKIAKPYALLHDATEAYLSDIPSPMKKLMPEYRQWENDLNSLIVSVFGIPYNDEIKAEVHKADRDILIPEMQTFLTVPPVFEELPELYFDISETPLDYKDSFMRAYNLHMSRCTK